MIAPYIVCPRCGSVSHNPNDVRERYCGRCHLFHEDGVPPGTACVACGHPLTKPDDITTTLDDMTIPARPRAMRPGDVATCGECLAPMILTPTLGVRAMTFDDWLASDPPVMLQVVRMLFAHCYPPSPEKASET